ncbi:MAG: hypothetical protein LBB45_05035 [Methanobrevibacter sp.]|jgi:hypothetical protein|nr:hypothetical protein [Candidatus Methanovirga basalitermitum]
MIRKAKKVILLSILLMFVCISSIYGAEINGNEKTIQMAIYDGPGSIENCVNRAESTIRTYGSNHSDVNINIKKISEIKTMNDLDDVDVLLMPGGTHGYIYFDYADGNVIREFVSSGHGYIGICAGSYAGCKKVDGNYDAYGVAPHVNCIAVYHEGLTKVNMAPEGENVLGMSAGEYIMDHENGPAMYSSSQGAISLATYNGIAGVGYSGKMSMVLDNYGSGKTILFGPHPESDNPKYPDMLGNAVKYVS